MSLSIRLDRPRRLRRERLTWGAACAALTVGNYALALLAPVNPCSVTSVVAVGCAALLALRESIRAHRALAAWGASR